VIPDRFRQLHIVCGAILAGALLMNVVLGVLLVEGALEPVVLPRPIVLGLFAVGVTLLASSSAVKGAVFKRIGAAGFGGSIDKVFAAYQTSTLIAFAMREAAGSIGFVLSLLTANPWWSWGLGGAAVSAMIFDWPKQEQVGM
jgi:hypothetical protein